MSRGTREIARLIKALGGNELSAYGLCHLGDYEATLSRHTAITAGTEKRL
jgi:glycerol-3-phosphate dehydrogenase (NAD(P)+)